MTRKLRVFDPHSVFPYKNFSELTEEELEVVAEAIADAIVDSNE